ARRRVEVGREDVHERHSALVQVLDVGDLPRCREAEELLLAVEHLRTPELVVGVEGLDAPSALLVRDPRERAHERNMLHRAPEDEILPALETGADAEHEPRVFLQLLIARMSVDQVAHARGMLRITRCPAPTCPSHPWRRSSSTSCRSATAGNTSPSGTS